MKDKDSYTLKIDYPTCNKCPQLLQKANPSGLNRQFVCKNSYGPKRFSLLMDRVDSELGTPLPPIRTPLSMCPLHNKYRAWKKDDRGIFLSPHGYNVPGYFAGVDAVSNKPTMWQDGATSWSCTTASRTVMEDVTRPKPSQDTY